MLNLLNFTINPILSNTIVLIIIVIITVLALKLTLKNKKTRCRNCKLACSHKKKPFNKNFQHNSEEIVNNNIGTINKEVYYNGKRNK